MNVRDVTEERQALARVAEADKQLVAASEELQAVIDHSNSSITVRDLDFRYTLGNRIFRESVGLSPDIPVVGLLDADVRDPNFITNQRPIDRQVLDGQRVNRHNVITTDGEDRVWQEENFPLFDNDGNVCALVRMATDVTEIKRPKNDLNWNLLGSKT